MIPKHYWKHLELFVQKATIIINFIFIEQMSYTYSGITQVVFMMLYDDIWRHMTFDFFITHLKINKNRKFNGYS